MQKYLHRAFQILFGVVLMIWVSLGISGWIPPPVLPRAEPLRDAIFASGYIIPSVLLVYFLAGAAFLANRLVPLGAVVLFPVSLNILMFHTLMNPTPQSLTIASALFLANCYMLFHCRVAYRGMLQWRAVDDGG